MAKKELTLEEFKNILEFVLGSDLERVQEDIKKAEKNLGNQFSAFDYGMAKGREFEIIHFLEMLGEKA